MKRLHVIVLFFGIPIACISTKQMTPSAIKMVRLNNYVVSSTVHLPDPVNHKFIVTAEEFSKTFHMTKASPGTAVVPDFNSQSVAAIILPGTRKVISIEMNKAEIEGSDLNIYYTITDTTSWTTYPHVIKALTALPKTKSIKQVNFYNRRVKEKTILVND